MNQPHTFVQPAATTFTVADLVASARAGKIRIPQFQRPLRWKWDDVRRLFDSISKGYPIGSVLLWRRPAPKGQVKLGPISMEASDYPDAFWVVDGQQRITSLSSALSTEGLASDDFAVAYDLDERLFVRPPKTESPTVIPLPVLFDLQKLIQWGQDHPEMAKRMTEASAVTTAIRQFSIPAYIVEQQDEGVLRDIFDRMNNYGRRLSRAEVFGALHPGEQGDAPGQGWFERIIDEIESEFSFGRCDDDTVLKAILARRGPDVTREIREEFGEARKNRDFSAETKDEAYRLGGEALKRAVQFLQSIGVPHLAFLPYRYQLIVLTRFFSHFLDPDERNRALLRRWFWRTSLVGPNVYSGSWNQALRSLSACVIAEEETQSVQRLLSAIDTHKGAVRLPDLKAFRPNHARSRVALCALWDLQPISFSSLEPYTRSDLADVIGEKNSPLAALQRLVPSPPPDARQWLANLMFNLEGEKFRGVGAEATKSDASLSSLIQSHALNDELLGRLTEALSTKEPSDSRRFLEVRHLVLAQIVDAFIQGATQWDFEDTPPLDSFDLDDDYDEEEDGT